MDGTLTKARTYARAGLLRLKGAQALRMVCAWSCLLAMIDLRAFAADIAAPLEPDFDQGARGGQIIRAPEQSVDFHQRETQADRLERLYRSGVKTRPEPPPATDYLSVLRSRTEKEGALPNLPPELQFSFGFGSWFPLAESEGRESKPLGSHHIQAMVYSFAEDRVAGRFADPLPASWGRLSLWGVSLQGETMLPGFDPRGNPIRYAVLFNDFELGLEGSYVWQRPAGSWGHLEWTTGLAYLPLRIRQLVDFGKAVPRDKDFQENGAQFNASGGHFRVALSYVVLSMFEIGVFGEAGSAFPAEVRARAGLQFGLRSPRSFPADPQVTTEPQASGVSGDTQTSNGRENRAVAPQMEESAPAGRGRSGVIDPAADSRWSQQRKRRGRR